LGLRFNQRLAQTKSEKIKSELAALKSQINPHFIFNTLNNIYGQAISKSDNTADSIAKLSAMMRYVLTETSQEQVPLKKEIQYLENYVQLQRIRLTHKTDVVFDIKGNIDLKKIPPLLLISFIENAFKYGVSNEIESTISIKIHVWQQAISLSVRNDKLSKENGQMNSLKIGIANTKKRLDLIYSGNYSLKIAENDKYFEVNLKIPLTC
jgi:LytS/YehU family sensor histidine kinase